MASGISSFQQPVRTGEAARLRQRAESLLSKEITFIHNPGFSRLKLESVAMPAESLHADEDQPHPGRSRTRLSALFQTPLLTPAGEHHLFRRMNYLKYQAHKLRGRLDARRPRKRLVEEVEQLLEEAAECRKLLVEANLRLVAAIARKFPRAALDFEELLSEGNLVLLNAVDKFDYGRGFRFSTYATHAIQRHFYRQLLRRQKRRNAEVETDSDIICEMIGCAPIEEPAEELPAVPKEVIAACLNRLDDRDRAILVARYGLEEGSEEKTLKVLAAEIGLSKERVRQLQFRAVDQLRDLMYEELQPVLST